MQRYRKILSVLLVLTMIISLLPTYAFAAGTFTATVGSASVTAGETVEIDVSVANNPGFANTSLYIDYDHSKLELKSIADGDLLKGVVASAEKAFFNYAGATDITGDGSIVKLTFYVLPTASGDVTVSLKVDENADGSFMTAEDEEVPVTFVSGTITVKASTDGRTVKFMNGDKTVGTYTVANGDTLSAIPGTPAAENGQSFLGWYAVSGEDYLLDSVDETISGTEASTKTAITADTTYRAIWASSAMIAAGYKTTTDGKTAISGVSQAANLQTLVTGHNGGTVKLLQDVELGSTYLTVASGETLTLDLNGKTLSGNGCIDTVNYNGDYGILLNNGTLALISSAETRGKIALADAGQSMFGYAAIENKGLITRMENIDVQVTTDTLSGNADCGAVAFNSSGDYSNTTSVAVRKIDNCSFSATKASAFTQSYGPLGEITNSTFTGGYYDEDAYADYSAVVLTNGTLTSLKNCTITNNQSGGAALYIGFNSTIESIENCTITGHDGIVIKGNSASNKSTIRSLSAEVTASSGYALTVEDSAAEIAITGGKYKGSAGLFNTQSNTTITYPEGQTLLKGTDDYWALSEGYNVYFRNWDGTLLQQVSCAANGTAAYTGETPARSADENYVYTFSGWNTMKDGTGTTYTGNEVPNVTSDLTLYAQYSTVSARVVTLQYTSGGTGSDGKWLTQGGYPSLKAAMDALNSNNGSYNNVVITLNEDAVETSKVEVKKNVTIDLNGHTLTINNNDNGIEVTASAAMSKAVTLTIRDSVGNGRYEHTSSVAGKYAIMNAKSMTNAQAVVIESGTIEEKGTGCSAICAGDSGGYARVDITGGTIIGAENGLVAKGGSFAISGGTIEGGTNGIYVSSIDSNDRRSSISGGDIIANGAEGYALKLDYAASAQYIELSGGRFKNTANPTNLYPAKDNNGADVALTFLNGTSLSPAPDSEGFYAVRVVGSYTLALTADKEHYNAGETVTVTVSAYGTTADSINSFGFTPKYDTDKLTLGEVTSLVGGTLETNPTNGKSGYVVKGEGLAIGATATKLVKITFTAKDSIDAATDITLIDLEMTKSGSDKGDSVTVEKALTVNLHDIRVTLTAANGSINGGASVTLYAKYGATGLYSDAARTEKTTTVSVSANDGYRLNDKTGESLWLCGETGYADFNAIAGLSYTESMTFALQTTKVWTISFNTDGVTGGSLSNTNQITVDNGTTLSAAGLPTATANTGYTFTGWKVGSESGTVNIATYEVKDNIRLTPVFTAQSYAFTTTANQSTVTVTAGVTDGKATYGQDITFTVAPNSGYIVKQVSYTISDGTATAITAANGTYTIPGRKIVGSVKLEITTVPYYQITFKAGTGISLTETTLYTFGDGSGFYTDATFASDKKADVPTPTAQAGYRLADHADESLWKAEDETGYTAESVKTATFTADTTLTAQSVKTYTVTFESADTTKAAISGTQTVDEGSTISTIPAATYTAGYTFDHWTIGDATYASDDALKTVTITADTTVKLVAKNASYTLVLPEAQASYIMLTPTEGIGDNNSITHGTGIKFTLIGQNGYVLTGVSYQIGNGASVPVEQDSVNVYVVDISGGDIIGDVTLTLTLKETHTVKFKVETTGTGFLNNGDRAGTSVIDGNKLSTGEIPTIAPAPGYQFEGWYKGNEKVDDIGSEIITADVTYTARFMHATYGLVLPDGLTLTDKDGKTITNATHGKDLTFTPKVDDKVVTGITATINGNAVTVAKNSNGTYIIAGDAIIGDLTITATTVTGGWKFIQKGTAQEDGYAILTTDEQIAIFEAGRLNSGTYLLDGKKMFYSNKYDGYVKIVAAAETAETLSAKLSTGEGTTTDISYSGDINDDDKVTPADGGMINDALHEVDVTYELTEKQRLEMDVNGDKKVTTVDIVTILQTYVTR